MPESSLLEFDTGLTRTGDTRRRNLLVVLACIESHGTVAQRDIGDETGLPHAAVSLIITQLSELGLLDEGAPTPTGHRGRPRRMLSLASGAATAIGIDIDAEGVRVRAVDLGGRIVASGEVEHRSTTIEPAEFSRTVFDLVSDTVPTAALAVPLSITIAIPGLASEGITTSTSRGWYTREVDDLFAAAPPNLVLRRVINDGDAAVTAEYTRGSASPSRNITVLHGSDGLAGGIVCEGRLLLGYAGAASSLGHVPTDSGGVVCDCGNRGCLVTSVSISAFARSLGRGAELGATTSTAFAERLGAEARAGSSDVLTVLDSARAQISRLSRMIGAVVSPEIVVLTGNLMPLAPWLVTHHTRTALQRDSSIDWESPVVASTLAGDSVVIGAAELARRALLLQPEVTSAARRPVGAQVSLPRPEPER